MINNELKDKYLYINPNEILYKSNSYNFDRLKLGLSINSHIKNFIKDFAKNRIKTLNLFNEINYLFHDVLVVYSHLFLRIHIPYQVHLLLWNLMHLL